MNYPRCRCAKEPNRRASVIGINMPLRSIEEMVDADGAHLRFARVDRKNPRQRAAVRECSLLRTRPRGGGVLSGVGGERAA